MCSNVGCGHTFIAVVEVIRTVSPSACPDPEVCLPMPRREGAPTDVRRGNPTASQPPDVKAETKAGAERKGHGRGMVLLL